MGDTLVRPVVKQMSASFSLSDGFLDTAATMRSNSPLLAALAEGAAADAELLRLAGSLGPGQPPSLLLFVASYLLNRSPGEPLRDYFPCHSDHPKPFHDAFPIFREFCLRRSAEMRSLLATRTLQMTVVERASTILLALDRVSDAVGRAPLGVIELGCSAGLLLPFDRYRYDFGPFGRFGDPGAEVAVQTELRGAGARSPVGIPPIAARLGIDLKLADPTDADAVDWICSCIFPEWEAARANIRLALDGLARNPVDLRQGDAMALLPEAIAQMPGPLCVYHSFCTYQWPDELRARLDATLAEVSRHRDIHRVSIEGVNRGPGQIVHQLFKGGDLVSGVFLGQCDLFGRWIDVAG